MENRKIAVVTTCQNDFNRYKASQPKEIQRLLRKISVLKDVEESYYLKAILLFESKNVTDFVITKVKNMSALKEDLRYNPIYYSE